jgi:AcrR family transcriptional regulator
MESKRRQNHTRQRHAILRAATDLFVSQGFDGVTMAEVAVKAGVVRATVFNYFPSKRSLVATITDDVFGYYNAIVERAIEERDASVPALLKTLLVHMGEGIEHTREFYSGVFREMLRMRCGLDENESSRALKDGAIERLQRLMQRGQARGELRSDLDPMELARAFESLSMGTIVDWLYSDPTDSLGVRMATTASLFLGGACTDARGDSQIVPGLVPLSSTPTGPGLPDVEEAKR